MSVSRGLILFTLGWGGLAFGAVYPWAYIPLAGLAALSGAMGFYTAGKRGPLPFTVLWPAIAVAAAVAVQLVPLDTSMLARVSPALDPLLATIELGYLQGVAGHTLSVNPESTQRALGLFAAFVFFMVGVTGSLSKGGAKWLAQAIMVLGVIVALIGIIQRPFASGKIYGFWAPIQDGTRIFGPFVNRNHFAGWMMMALPVTLGLLMAETSRSSRGTMTRRERLLWLGTNDASRVALLAGATAVMALSLVLTLSRSGIGAFGLSIILFACLVYAKAPTVARKRSALVYLAGLFVLIVIWAGVDAISARFSSEGSMGISDRSQAWQDAAGVARAFPLTGTGINTYGLAMLVYQQHHLDFQFNAAHNDYLQVAAEGGWLVALPAAALLVAIVLTIRRRFKESQPSLTLWWLRSGAVTGMVAIGFQEIVDFSLQIPGNAVLFAALCAIALHRAPAAHAAAGRGKHARL